MTRIKMTVLAAAALFAVASAPVSAQDDDDDDEMSGGALAVLLLLGVGGAASEDGLQAQLKSALDQQKTPYSDAQLKSLTERTAVQIKAQRSASEFTVCADGGRPCVKVVRQ